MMHTFLKKEKGEGGGLKRCNCTLALHNLALPDGDGVRWIV